MHLMVKEQFKKQFMSIFEKIIMLTEKIQTDCCVCPHLHFVPILSNIGKAKQ